MEIGCEKAHFLNKRIGAVVERGAWCPVYSTGFEEIKDLVAQSLWACLVVCSEWRTNSIWRLSLLLFFCVLKTRIFSSNAISSWPILRPNGNNRERLMAQETLKRTIAQSWDELEHVKCNNLGGGMAFLQRETFSTAYSTMSVKWKRAWLFWFKICWLKTMILK